jgi:hypothetical protein
MTLNYLEVYIVLGSDGMHAVVSSYGDRGSPDVIQAMPYMRLVDDAACMEMFVAEALVSPSPWCWLGFRAPLLLPSNLLALL